MTARSPQRQRWRTALLLLPLLMGSLGPASALTPTEHLADPALETRARDLSKQLRCLVCQNQSIDDSDAELALDLRRVVREELTAGRTDREILDSLVERYGDFVRLRPPVKPSTWLLWAGPFLVLALGGGLAVYLLRDQRRRAAVVPSELTAEERLELEATLADSSEAAGSR